MKTELVKIASLKPDKDNARRHGERSIASIAESLRAFGQQKPIVVTSKNVVVAGNGTLEAAKSLGWTELAVVYLPDGWSKKQIQQFAIADNRTADLSDWDVDQLVSQLNAFDADATVAVGFTEDEIKDLLEFRDRPFVTVRANVDDLIPHPKNYQNHPDDQLDQIIASIEQNGFYRNIVIANDNTILAGHGVVLAVKKMGRKRVPVIQLPIDSNSPQALKIIVSDNEMNNMADVDDRALTDMLKNILDESETGLAGTGFNAEQVGLLAMVTRFEHEIADKQAAAEWIGMEDFEPQADVTDLIIHFRDAKDREEFVNRFDIGIAERNRKNWSAWWPYTGKDDVSSLKVVADD